MLSYDSLGVIRQEHVGYRYFSTTHSKDTEKDTLEITKYLKKLKDDSGIIFPTRSITNIPPYKEIDTILVSFAQGTDYIFKQNLIGLYLSGSLSYGNFNLTRSDIDLVTVLKSTANEKEMGLIKGLHKEIEKNYETWADRLECSYVPIDMLMNISPPKAPRPYYNNRIFYEEAPYGNEWIINKYLLYKYGVPLIGPQFRELTSPVDVVEVQKACLRDLFQEWAPKMTDPEWLNNSHYQSYMVLNLCRILYTIMQNPTGSKTVAASWVKNEFNSQWRDVIETAEQWQYGKEMTLQKEVILFTKFVIKKALEVPI